MIILIDDRDERVACLCELMEGGQKIMPLSGTFFSIKKIIENFPLNLEEKVIVCIHLSKEKLDNLDKDFDLSDLTNRIREIRPETRIIAYARVGSPTDEILEQIRPDGYFCDNGSYTFLEVANAISQKGDVTFEEMNQRGITTELILPDGIRVGKQLIIKEREGKEREGD